MLSKTLSLVGIALMAGYAIVSLHAQAAPPAANAGAIYYVDVDKGNNSNPGTSEAPFQNIGKALEHIKAGDTIKFVKVDQPIPQMVMIKSQSGDPGKPIVIDGGGNTFTGADPLNPADWTQEQPGLYSDNHLFKSAKVGEKINPALIQRMYFLWNGQQNRMGRSSKGMQPKLPPASELSPGQWTCDTTNSTFYLKIDPAKTLANYKIEIPLREDGVALRDVCAHLVIRNFNVTHVWNDGFNIHGETKDILFKDITATECGDDGLSEHEKCEVSVSGFTSRRNSTGMCHGDACVSTCDHVVLEDNYAYNLLLRNGTHIFTDSTISAAAPKGGNAGIRLNDAPYPPVPGDLNVKMTRCHIPFPATPNPNGKDPFIVDGAVVLEMNDCTVDGKITHIGAPAVSK